jgi:endonuclease YncB( thermonuclease family)
MDFTGDLTAICLDKIDKFSYKGYSFNALVTDVYDGDTCHIVFYESKIPRKYAARISGYDSPEIKPLKSIADRELHVDAAKSCKKFLYDLICGKIVRVDVVGDDKYGRLLIEIYHGQYNISSLMKSIGCLSYEGDTKKEYTVEGLGKIITNIKSLSI